MIPRVLTIAGSDSGGGAGIQADLKTFSALGVYGMSVITAITAQNTCRVYGVEGITPAMVGLQFEAVLSDIGVDSVKTGMLFNASIIQAVATKLEDSRIPYVVVDPVMVATSGDPLLEKQAEILMKEKMMPVATLVTPNLPEAEVLADMKIRTNDDIHKACLAIKDLGCRAVLIKGGHGTDDAVDWLYDGESFSSFSARRIESNNTHGTGCTYSAAIAANLGKGLSLKEAIRSAKKFVTLGIEHSFSLGKGHGPLNHLIYHQPEI